MPTATYLLKADRSKKIKVVVPVFGIATILQADGKKLEMPRSEFDQQYEPELKPANPAGADFSRPSPSNEALDRLTTQVAALTGRVNDIGDKVDQIHAVAVPPTNTTND